MGNVYVHFGIADADISAMLIENSFLGNTYVHFGIADADISAMLIENSLWTMRMSMFGIGRERRSAENSAKQSNVCQK
jgi:hypothetical protein